jgi:hypothetical protein
MHASAPTTLIAIARAIFAAASAVCLLAVSVYFGLSAMPTEMGLSIVAGSLGMAFANLDKLSEFSGGGFSAKLRTEFQAVIDKETEPGKTISHLSRPNLDANTLAVLGGLSDPRYTWRTLDGIAGSANLSEAEAWKILAPLVGNQLVHVSNKRGTGQMIWSLTSSGRNLLAEQKAE